MHLPDVGLSVAIDNINLIHFTLVIPWVLASLHPDHAATLPGVHLVLPAVVVQLDGAEELFPVRIPVVEDIIRQVCLDAEVAETSRVQRVLVDSAALIGWALWVDLIFEASNVTERSALAITNGLDAYLIAPDHLCQFIIFRVLAISDLFSLPVVLLQAT